MSVLFGCPRGELERRRSCCRTVICRERREEANRSGGVDLRGGESRLECQNGADVVAKPRLGAGKPTSSSRTGG